MELGLYALGAVILFFAAPYYTMFVGIGSLLCAAYFFPNSSPSVVIGGFELVGFVWVGFKLHMWLRDKRRAKEEERRRQEELHKEEEKRKRKRARKKGTRPEQAAIERRRPVTEAEAQELLGVSPGCTPAERTKAYHRKVSEWHPDKLDMMAPELKEYANRQTARINEAYERLKSARV